MGWAKAKPLHPVFRQIHFVLVILGICTFWYNYYLQTDVIFIQKRMEGLRKTTIFCQMVGFLPLKTKGYNSLTFYQLCGLRNSNRGVVRFQKNLENQLNCCVNCFLFPLKNFIFTQNNVTLTEDLLYFFLMITSIILFKACLFNLTFYKESHSKGLMQRALPVHQRKTKHFIAKLLTQPFTFYKPF